MTANAIKGDRERCLAAGKNDYLSKRVSPDIPGSVPASRLGSHPQSNNQPHAEQPGDQGRAELNARVFPRSALAVVDRAALLGRVEGDERLLATLLTPSLEERPKNITGLTVIVGTIL